MEYAVIKQTYKGFFTTKEFENGADAEAYARKKAHAYKSIELYSGNECLLYFSEGVEYEQ